MNRPIFITLLILTILMPLFWLPFNTDQINFPKSVLFIGLTLLALLFWLIGILKSKKIEIKRSILDYPIIALLVVYFCSALLSVDKYVSFSKFVVILFMGIFYFLIVQIITPKRKKILLKALVISSLIAGIWFLVGAGLVPALGRPQGSPLQVNPLGTQSVLVALLAILVPIIYRWRFWGIAPLLIILGILFAVNFKIGWYVLGAGTLVWLVFSIIQNTKYEIRNTKFKIVPLIILAISILMIVLNLNISQYLNLQLPAEVSLSKQVSWSIALQNSQSSIKRGLLGSGPETFWYAFSKFRPERFNQNILWQVRFQKANNFWFENLATIGWLGVLAWLLIFGLGIWKNPKYIVPILVASIFTDFSIVLLFLLFLLLGTTKNKQKIFVKNLPASSLGLGFIVILSGMIIFAVFVGRIYAADYYFTQNNIEKAVQSNKYNPQYYLALSQQALLDLQGMRNQEKLELLLARAVNSSKKAIDLSPYNAAFYQVRGQIFASLQEKDWAVKSYEKAIELEPTNPVLYQELGRIKEDIGILEKAVALKPELALGQYELGRLYYNQGDISKAELCFTKAIEISPNYSNALYSLALIYQKQNKNKEALELFKKVLELNPDNEEVKQKISNF